MNKPLIPFFLLFITMQLIAQPGKQGTFTVVSNNTIVNEYTTLSQDAKTGDNLIDVVNSTLNSNNRFSNVLSAGDLIFIIQLQGATIKTNVNDSTWGTILDYHNCGNNEIVEVKSVNGNQIILANSLKNSYTSKGHVEIVRVPRYSSLNINNNAGITSDPWNGSTGGVVSVEVSGNLIINGNGNIDASGKGFRPGVLDMNANGQITTFRSLNSGDGGEKG